MEENRFVPVDSPSEEECARAREAFLAAPVEPPRAASSRRFVASPGASPAAWTGFVPPREFSAGTIVSQTLSTFAKSPLFFLFLAALSTVPGLLLERFMRPGLSGRTYATLMLVELMNRLLQGCIAYGVYQILRGQRVRLATALLRGFSRIGALFLASLLLFIGTMLGYVLLVIPGLILTCAWFVTVPACVVEELGAMASIKRSERLTKGHRWTIFGTLVIWFLAYMGIYLVRGFILGAFGGGALGSVLTELGLSIVMGAIPSIMAATIYYNLRIVKEGVSVDNLAKVFD